MFNYYREQKILEILKAKPNIRVSELSDSLQVSEATIRRDLNRLQGVGKIKRVHGGAVLFEKAAPEPPVVLRGADQADEKKRIGRAAVQLISPGETIFIGSGTTTEAFARNLVGRKDISIITNSLLIISILAQEAELPIISTGGLLRISELSFIGHLTEQALQELRPNKVFMSIRAISLVGGLTNDYMPEVSTDRVIIQSAPEVVLLADHTKFNKISTAFVAPLSAVHTVITDIGTPGDIRSSLQELGVRVIAV